MNDEGLTGLRILVLEPNHFPKEALDKLKGLGRISIGPLSRNQLEKDIEKFDVVLTRFSHSFDGPLLRRAKQMKFLVTPTTGEDHIDTKVAAELGIKVVSLKDQQSRLNQITSTAEHTFALLLGLIRAVPHGFQSVTEGIWDRKPYLGTELFGKTLGVLGFGRIGHQVAHRAQAFGMKVIGSDEPLRKRGMPGLVDLDSLLEISDFVSVHVPFSPETKGLLGLGQFKRMKREAFLVNTSRGEVVDESALILALREGLISGAALDVVTDERNFPRSNAALIDYAKDGRNLLITPHIAGWTAEGITKAESMAVDILSELIEGQ